MRLKQIIVIAIVIAIAGYLYFQPVKGLIKPKVSKATSGVVSGSHPAAVSESACRLLPAELTSGFGPPLFPPGTFSPHVEHEPAWWRWAAVMWLVQPAAYRLFPASAYAAPFLTLTTTPELTAAAVCARLAAAPDRRDLIADLRRQLARANPWLDPADQRAAVLAVEAAHPRRVNLPHEGFVAASPSRANKQKRGRPPAIKTNPKRVKEDIKLHRDWQVSRLTKKEFLRVRGLEEDEGLQSIDRGRKHSERVGNKSGK